MAYPLGMALVRNATDRGVDGVHGKRVVATSGSSPEAVQRCAAGAGLDAGGAHQSTIMRAVTCGPPSERTNDPGNILDEAMTPAR